MGDPTIKLAWDGYDMDFRPGRLSGVRWEVVFDRARGTATHYVDGALRSEVVPPSTGDGSMVGLLADACAADLESESIGVDALTIEVQ